MRRRVWIFGMLTALILSIEESSAWTWIENREVELGDPYFIPSDTYFKDVNLRPLISKDAIDSLISVQVLDNLNDFLKSQECRRKKENEKCYPIIEAIGLNVLSRVESDPVKVTWYSSNPNSFTEYGYAKINEWYEHNRRAITLSRLREIWLYYIIDYYAGFKTFSDAYNYPYNHKLDSIIDEIEKDARLINRRPLKVGELGLSEAKTDSIIEAECKSANEEFYYSPRIHPRVIEREITPEFFKEFESLLRETCEGRVGTTGYNDTFYNLVLIGELGKYFKAYRDSNETWIKEDRDFPVPTGYACGKMLEWLEEHKNSFTLERMRELLRMKREIDYADFKGIDSSKYHQRIDSLFNVMELESAGGL